MNKRRWNVYDDGGGGCGGDTATGVGDLNGEGVGAVGPSCGVKSEETVDEVVEVTGR